MRYIDLFAGIGGFHFGIQKAVPDAECMYSNEWDKYASSVYRKHYGECDERDIRTVPASEIPEFDLLCAGFPCQSFSVAGKRGGFDDTRGTLFFEIARIVKEKQPRLLLLENVKGLLSHDKGRTFGIIIATLDELGYDVQWQVLNSKNFGVPQNRERVYIVANLRGTPRPEVFPLTESTDSHLEEITSGVSDAQRIYSTEGIAKTLKGLGGGLGAKTGLYAISEITSQIVRRLTPVECERLQGFPDNWTEYGENGEKMSDTQRYKMCGNAVTTNVVAEVVKKMIE